MNQESILTIMEEYLLMLNWKAVKMNNLVIEQNINRNQPKKESIWNCILLLAEVHFINETIFLLILNKTLYPKPVVIL